MRDKKSQNKTISKNQSTPEKITNKKKNKQQKENTPMRKELSSKL